MLRGGRDPLRALALASATRDLAICGVIRCEVGRGIRDRNILRRFHRTWDVMLNVPTDNRLWNEIEDTLWKLDRQGTVLPLTDVVIACSARRINASVLTYDRHFDEIPGLQVIAQL
jgi:predicted nucleic acid-binding protein